MRFDIGWSDLFAGFVGCCVPNHRAKLETAVTAHWPNRDTLIPCLSVRSGFDSLLSALALPTDSEVLLTALTVPHMPKIVREHGLVPVSVDLEPGGFRPDIAAIKVAMTAKSRVLVIAHLFGDRIPMQPILDLARQHNLIVVEDCAQSYSGMENQFHMDSDVALFSFGPIKTATALQGGLVRVKDDGLRQKIKTVQQQQTVQSRWSFAKRILKYVSLKLISTRLFFGLFVRLCRLLKIDYDQYLNRSSSNFIDGDLLDQLRQRPSLGLLSLMNRRFRTFNPSRIDSRIRNGRQLAELTGCQRSADHVHWVFPVICAQPEEAVDSLRKAGFDATLRSRLAIVDASESPRIQETYDRTVFVPFYPELSDSAVEKIGRIVRQYV